MKSLSSGLLSYKSWWELCIYTATALYFTNSPWWSYVISFPIVIMANELFGEPAGKYKVRPSLSLKARATNCLLRLVQKFQLLNEFKPLTLESLKKEAIAKCGGYDNFGDDYYEDKYRFIIALANDLPHSPIGHLAIRSLLLRCLVTKLRIENELQSPPLKTYVTSRSSQRPLFVVGMPRTGTTYLHRLLSLDPQTRAPLMYELIDPVPRVRDDKERDEAVRVRHMRKVLDVVEEYVPDVANVHELKADGPEECLLSMSQDAPLSFETFYMLNARREPWDWDATIPYRNYRKVLRLLDYYRETNDDDAVDLRWVLKCPVHLGFLPYLYDVFGSDVRVVWTHRDVESCVPSMASFLRVSQSLCEGSVIELDKLGDMSLAYAKEFLKRGDESYSRCAAKATRPPAHVRYPDLVSDPVGTVKRLYEDFGYEFTAEYRGILERFVEENRRAREERVTRGGRKRMHEYELEDYGLTEERLEEELGWYTRKYLMEEGKETSST